MALHLPDELARLIPSAVAGDRDAVGNVLEWYRDYLTVLVRIQIGRRLQKKVDAADVVQDVFLDAHRQFSHFHGTTGGELSAWLRTLLAGHIAALIRRYCQTQARNVELERAIEVELDSSSERMGQLAATSGCSPSATAVKREGLSGLATALNELAPDYREVILLRQIEDLPFSEIAERMGRSVDSVQKLWVRGLEALRQALDPGVPPSQTN
jgi:RNA polymerase sigma-70 factor, ECF subfamily